MKRAEFRLSLYGDPHSVPGIAPAVPLTDALAAMQTVNGLVAITLRGLEADGWTVEQTTHLARPGGCVVLAHKSYPDAERANDAEARAEAQYRQNARGVGAEVYLIVGDALSGTQTAETPTQEEVGSGKSPVTQALDTLRANHPDVELWVTERDGGLVLNLIRVERRCRREGLAGRAFADLLKLADEHDLIVALTPAPPAADERDPDAMTEAALVEWYRRQDFRRNTGQSADHRFRESYIREPKCAHAWVPNYDPDGMDFVCSKCRNESMVATDPQGTSKVKWTRTSDGDYVAMDGRVLVSDNGPGYGSSKGSGRWAVVVDGTWVSNEDFLRDAKALAARTVAVTA